jgi:dinuclear metal center YbgI/SA1388 family protein
MNYTINHVIQYLEEIAPLSYQESFDNAGLLIGDRNAVLQKGLICLDVTQAVMNEAIAKKVNLIVSHHPFIFNPLKKITGNSVCENIIIQAIKNDIAIYAIHTNLDNISQGVNRRFVEKLGLNNCRILKPVQGNLCKLVTYIPEKQADDVRNALFAAGAGKIGNYDACSYNSEGYGTFRANEKANPFVGEKFEIHKEKEIRVEVIFSDFLKSKIITTLIKSHPYEEPAYDIIPLENFNPLVGSGMIGELETTIDETEFLHFVKNNMQVACIKHSKLRNKKIKKVALCGGSGAFLVGDAIRQHADIFISSEFKHNHFIDFADTILLADIGHYESEIQTKHLLHDVLIEKFSNFVSSENEQNPISYL